MDKTVGVLTMLIAIAASAEARADDAPGPSYGTSVGAVDALCVSAAVISTVNGSWQGALASYGAYVVASPVIHIAHGRPNRAALSFMLRLFAVPGAALLVSGTGYEITAANGSAGPDGFNVAAISFIAGGISSLLTMSLVDIFVLARAEPTVAAPTWRPTVVVTRGGAQAALGGTF